MNCSYLLLIFGVVACLVHSANSILCYRCTEQEGDQRCTELEDCNRITMPSFLQSYFGNRGIRQSEFQIASGCYKKVVQNSPSYTQPKMIERGCFFGDLNNPQLGCMKSPAHSIQYSCDVCARDRCNSSTSILPKLTLTLFTAAFLSFFGKFICNNLN